MDRTKLREAIVGISEHDDVLTMNEVDHRDFRMVVAAACAYACERCGGTGHDVDTFWMGYITCPDCAEFRRIADGGE